MYDTCPNCHAIAQPEWERCRICGADLSPEARAAAHPPALAAGPPPRSPDDERDRRIAFRAIAITGVVLTIGFVAWLVASNQEDADPALEEAKRRVTSTLPPVPTTVPASTTTLPQSDEVEALGVVLPANPHVTWARSEDPDREAQIHAELNDAGLRPGAVELWYGQPRESDGPAVEVVVFTSNAGRDVRTSAYMKFGFAPPGWRVLNIDIAGRPVAWVPESWGPLTYIFGVHRNAMIVLSDTNDGGAGGMNRVAESIITANP